MSAPTSLHAFVFADLRSDVRVALDDADVLTLLDALAERGWRPRQLRDRVGALPVQPSATQDAAFVGEALRALLSQQSPQEAYDDELRRRAYREQLDRESAHEPASAEDKARWVAAIRSGLTGRARVSFGPPVRLRPDCSLCEGEAAYFVRRDVHLCGSCVDLLAAGEVRADRATGT
ncbi:MAG: hypothetical protein ABIO67_07760 [Mycobacteriales bacterium]